MPTKTVSIPRARRSRLLFQVIVLASIVILAAPSVRVPSANASSVDGAAPSRFKEIGRVDLAINDPEFPPAHADNSGWLILDSAARRGYNVFETSGRMIIRSFDLDTLRPRRSVKLPGVPVPGGDLASGGGSTVANGDIVHAVDSVGGRLFIAIGGQTPTTLGNGPDDQRLLSHILVVDEKAFDEGRPAFGALTFPVGQTRLQAHPLVGMAVNSHHPEVAATGRSRLVLAFASPYLLTSLHEPIPGPYDHTLTQWHVPQLSLTATQPVPPALTGATPATLDWERRLDPCATAPLTSRGTSTLNTTNLKNLQWGILTTRDAVYTGCQSAPQSGAVVRVEVDPETGQSTPGVQGQQIFPVGKPLVDVLVDEGGARLHVRTFGGGSTFWVFDTATLRFSGSIAGAAESVPVGAGMDPGTGRLWMLTPDTCVERAGGGSLPLRGGIRYSEARLDPVPAAENVAPEMAFNSWWKIPVDPVTRRIFIRRGTALLRTGLVYPNCETSSPTPPERFYRVFEDRIPVAVQPEGFDDSSFTTNVPEAAGVTQASYLGQGSGYGSRLVLTGGIDAATRGAATSVRSLCGRDDRELLSGSVGKVEVSDQNTAAEAAGLDADGRTQEVLGDPLGRCKPQAPQPTTGAHGEEWNKCSPHESIPAPPDDELAFDERQSTSDGKAVDGNKDRCPDRDGQSRYAARCLGEEGTKGPKNFQSSKRVPRQGFTAEVTCDAPHDKANGSAEGALGAAELDALQAQANGAGAPAPDPAAESFRVGRSSSVVTVTRALGKGITVKVDSWARGIDIPGVGNIGMVRSEATSTATGRDGGAEGDYTRTICDVAVGDLRIPGCLGDSQQELLVNALNDALGGRGQARLRQPDPVLKEGTEHGFLAAVQRDRKELFNDQIITKDRSLTVPGLEIILYQGDGGAWGAGRQVLQLAGVQASTSYGIACLYGMGAGGKCAREGEGFGFDEDDFGLPEAGEPEIVTITEEVPYEVPADDVDGDDSGGGGILQRIVRVLKAPFRAVEEALRLAFNNPRELGLLAAVWALLFAPCWLGERRRSIGGLRARRAGA